ncbi:MAG: hypothetical protein HOB40_08295 [Candidatus Marinimicrobia bacterium]|jgi:predicted carbohydrate-binding protein with CBM5 and CBM33 domain|nr:hypothetical protein [Candidatus Neomarinimicrobiota bacterium]MBT3839919.1 hypothetical protein [Candidatus Neomarinimicrobiota bacterium]MBT3998466.1 hypothetical protein [Candidatus Neomarinimicrobiota bacterium]MBT4281716.1 hypothetical protein [Candidatus Neomarinimicrobiota bacterium]MBT4579340.1 hypothetical protein [Candidatus Neomarinimicrobiota bacterium]
MKLNLKYSITSLMIMMMLWSCSKASGHGTVTMVLSGSVHGQLDPCG